MLELQPKSLCIFLLDGEYYALSAQVVEGIHFCGNITYIPGCPPYILGVIHLKGRIEAVLDLRILLGKPHRDPRERDVLIMISQNQIRAGLLIDGAEDIIEVDHKNISKVPSRLNISVQSIASGIYSWKEQTVVMLSSEILMDKLQETAL